MEVAEKKVWLCVTRESNGIHTGYFSSVVEEIKAHVAAFIRCPTAQVYYWLKRKGCIGEEANHLIRKCFMVEQQQKVTKSKYLKEKGVAVMKESEDDNIINAANKTGLFDMSLGLSDKEQREQMAKFGDYLQRCQGRIDGSLQLFRRSVNHNGACRKRGRSYISGIGQDNGQVGI